MLNTILRLFLLSLGFFVIGRASGQQHVIGWQTFEPSVAGNNNSGILDDAPDTNSTFDATPVGGSSGNAYLTGSIGLNASNSAWDGLGQASNNDFLNDPTFGESLVISNFTLANGLAGTRIGPFGNPAPNGVENGGTSSWKFAQADTPNQLRGDFSITNHSDYAFELEHIHFDARGLANPATSPNTLELRYLATPGELIKASDSLEVDDLQVLFSNTWAEKGVINISQSISESVGSVARISPGQKAAFRFTWSGNAGAGQAQIDNVAFSGTFRDQNGGFALIDPRNVPEGGANGPNVIVIIPDDQRWDATSHMQSTIASSGRTARFPWLASPTQQTPNMDRLTNEGVHFNNAFVVYSICSPSRATMLTGQYPHINGVTDNHTDFPASATTYATLLQEQGYATGYFGKWHMGEQKERPGFDTAVTFKGQGTYFETEFFDQVGSPLFTSSATDWVDDVSTAHAKNFITSQSTADRPFLMVLGFKTPHQPWESPARNSNLFSNDTPVSVPNLTVAPPFAPNANGGSNLGELRSYMRTVVGIDQNVGDILDHLDDLNIADDTAVIFISDNGFFRGEHRLGDKRSAYEESLRVPFMIRYPNAQASALKVDEIALNLDVAPTILDIAGVPVPESMQGQSLLPLMQGHTPNDWRNSFLFSYNIDPEFPAAAVVPHVGIRRADGLKLVNYSDDESWNELFDTNSGVDPYEIDNLYSSPAHVGDLDSLRVDLVAAAKKFGFMNVSNPQVGAITVQAGAGSLFQVETSWDLANWQLAGTFEGGGSPTKISLSDSAFTSSETIMGNPADYVLAEGPPVLAVQNFETLRVGSISPSGGRNAVLIFELPVITPPLEIARAELEVNVTRTFAQWDADLWVIGVKNETSPILEYSETSSGSAEVVKLENSIFDFTTSNTREVVKSNPLSRLTQYLQSFYKANPEYAGGSYIFLRVNPRTDIGVNEQRYVISSAENSDANVRPKLNLFYKESGGEPEKKFYRIRYGETSP